MARDLAARVPAEVRAELAATVAALEEHGPPAVAAMQQLGALTRAVWLAVEVPASLAPEELGGADDDEWAAVETATGIARGWELADELVDAHPDLAPAPT